MDQKLVSLATTKGGSGKSTLALTLPHARAFQGKRCCIVEADVQASLAGWAAERKEAKRPELVPVFPRYDVAELATTAGDMAKPLAGIVQGHDVTFLDLPGESSGEIHTRAAMVFSDVVLIPLRQTEFDMQSVADHVLPLIEPATEASARETRYFLVPTMTHPAARLEKLIGALDGTAAEVLPATLPYRKSFGEFAEGGRTLMEYSREIGASAGKRQAKKALADVDAIARAVIEALGL